MGGLNQKWVVKRGETRTFRACTSFSAYFWAFQGLTKGWFPKGWFWRMFPRNENQNEGTFGCSPGTKEGTRVRSHVPPERKPERGHVRQNHPFTKLPFYLPVIFARQLSLPKTCAFFHSNELLSPKVLDLDDCFSSENPTMIRVTLVCGRALQAGISPDLLRRPTKTGTRVLSPKPPFYETALLSPVNLDGGRHLRPQPNPASQNRSAWPCLQILDVIFFDIVFEIAGAKL